jgi:hypothetical protein
MVYILMKFREIIINGCGEVVDTKRRYPSLAARSGSIGFTKSFSPKAGDSLQSHNTKTRLCKVREVWLDGKGGALDMWPNAALLSELRLYLQQEAESTSKV